MAGHDERRPLLTSRVGDEEVQSAASAPESTERNSWLGELVALWKLVIPLWVTNVLEFGGNGVAVALVGHLGTKELNAMSIANLTATTLVFSGIIFGPASSLDTLANQSFGSSNPKLTSLYCQRVGLLIFILLIPATIILSFGERILLSLGQDPYVAALAGKALRVISIQFPFVAIFELCKKWLFAQGLVKVTTLCALITGPLGVGLMFLLTIGPDSVRIGFLGPSVAVVICQVCACAIIVSYCYFFAPRTAWGRWSTAIFYDLGPVIRLSLAGSATICSEWWSWDVVSIASSYLGSVAFAANSIAIFTTAIAYQLPFGVMMASSIRVGNCLGSQRPGEARFAAKVAWVSAISIGIANASIIFFYRHQLGSIFSKDPEVISAYANVAALIASLQLFDDITASSYGILRGAGLAGLAARSNLFSYWLLGMPTGFFLAFRHGWGLTGLWTGHVTGLVGLASLTTFFAARIDWNSQAVQAKEQTDATEDFLRNRAASAAGGDVRA